MWKSSVRVFATYLHVAQKKNPRNLKVEQNVNCSIWLQVYGDHHTALQQFLCQKIFVIKRQKKVFQKFSNCALLAVVTQFNSTDILLSFSDAWPGPLISRSSQSNYHQNTVQDREDTLVSNVTAKYEPIYAIQKLKPSNVASLKKINS